MKSYNDDKRRKSSETGIEIELEHYHDDNNDVESEKSVEAEDEQLLRDATHTGTRSRCNSKPEWLVVVLSASMILGLCWIMYMLQRKLRRSEWDLWQPYNSTMVAEVVGKKEWISTLLKHDIDGSYQPEGLRDLCQGIKWQEDLIISCDESQGGIGNVRNLVMDCFRYAIEAGATAIILPGITIRNPSVLTVLDDNHYANYDFYFDQSYIKSTFRSDCPQLHIYDSIDDLYGFPSVEHSISVHPPTLTPGGLFAGMVMNNPENFRPAFDDWLYAQWIHRRFRPSSRYPIHVRLRPSLFSFPITYDEPVFVLNFGRLFKFRSDIRRHTALALQTMSDRYNLNLDPSTGVEAGKYIGVHLRTSADAKAGGWASWEAQSNWYLSQARSSNLSIIYVASGDSDGIALLRTTAAKEGLTVVTKSDLLTQDYLKGQPPLTWDQQALIDYEILLRASSFGGIGESSFSCNVAIRRRFMAVKLGYEVSGEAGEIGMDGLSQIYGAFQDVFKMAMYP